MMEAKKRLPAYGKALFDARIRGDCNRGVLLVFGERWHRIDDRPMICVKPAEYEVGRFEFNLLQKLWVDIVDREYDDDVRMIDGDRAIYWLGAEVANYAVQVTIGGLDVENKEYTSETLENCAYCLRTNRDTRSPTWPAWFPSNLRTDYLARNAEYWAAKKTELAAIIRG